MQARIIETIDVGNTLGEGVLYRLSDATVWWADIQEKKLFCMEWPSLNIEVFNVPYRVGSFSFVDGRDDLLLVAFETGIALYSPQSGKLNWLSQVFEQNCGVRMNDGRTDASGRFWVGAMVERPLEKGEKPSANLYRTDSNGQCATVREGIHISNGLCWSPDTKTIYFADSPKGIIQRADFDLETEKIGIFSDFYTVENGSPDGAITDANGMYLSAIWGGNCILGIDETGKKRQEIEIPTSQVTCLALGGASGNTMFVTSAKDGLETLEDGGCVEPKAGSLFILETDFHASVQARANISLTRLAEI